MINKNFKCLKNFNVSVWNVEIVSFYYFVHNVALHTKLNRKFIDCKFVNMSPQFKSGVSAIPKKYIRRM